MISITPSKTAARTCSHSTFYISALLSTVSLPLSACVYLFLTLSTFSLHSFYLSSTFSTFLGHCRSGVSVLKEIQRTSRSACQPARTLRNCNRKLAVAAFYIPGCHSTFILHLLLFYYLLPFYIFYKFLHISTLFILHFSIYFLCSLHSSTLQVLGPDPQFSSYPESGNAEGSDPSIAK